MSRPDPGGMPPPKRRKAPTGQEGAPRLDNQINERHDSDSVAFLQQAEIAAAAFIARRHFLAPAIARVVAAELRLSLAEAGR